jgi:HEAT repeat protein
MKIISFFMVLTMVMLSGCQEQVSTSSGINGTSASTNKLSGKALDIVRKGLADNNNLLKIQAIEAVAITGRTELMPIVTKLLKSNSIGVRISAAIAIADTRYSPGEFAVRRLLHDKNKNVSIAAAYAMAKLGNRNFDKMIKNELTNKDQTVRANAALLLGKLGDKKNMEILYSTLHDSSSSTPVKMKAVEAIARLGDETIYQKKLWPLLISKYADDRIVGIRAMGALGTVDSINAIVTMLSDDIPEVKLCAAEELGRLGFRTGEVEVKDYFSKISPQLSPSSRRRTDFLAAMAIGRIGTESLKKYLPKLLNSRDREVQLGAAQAVLLIK